MRRGNGQHLYDYLLRSEHADDSPAFTFVQPDRTVSTYTRKALRSAVGELSEQLTAAVGDVERGHVTAVLSTSQEQQVLWYLGCLAAGLTPALLTPFNRKLNADSFASAARSVMQKVRPAVVIVGSDGGLEQFVEGSDDYCPAVVDAGTGETRRERSGESRRLSSDPAFVQFSSGTTGVKKAVCIDAEAAIWQLDAYARALRFGASHGNDADVVVSWLPLYHDMGFVTALHLPLAFGVHSVMLNPTEWVADPASYLRAVSEYAATVGWHPNFAFAFMAKRIKDDDINDVRLESIRHLVNCSEPVTYKSQELFVKRFSEHGLNHDIMTGCYAMAETTFAITHGIDSHNSGLDEVGASGGGPGMRRPGVSVGKALDGVRIELRSVDGKPVEDGVIAHVWVESPSLASGYLGDAETTRAFSDGWYDTGDLGYARDGELYICGRSKDLIIVAGHNVFPEDIESIVGETHGIKDGRVVAFAQFDERMQTERVIVLAESDGTATPVHFTAALKRLSEELQVDGARIEVVPPGIVRKSSSGKPARAETADAWRALHDQRA
jgi:fatty-acyl-CoA synthase